MILNSIELKAKRKYAYNDISITIYIRLERI